MTADGKDRQTETTRQIVQSQRLIARSRALIESTETYLTRSTEQLKKAMTYLTQGPDEPEEPGATSGA